MRLLQLQFDGTEAGMLDLHPLLTVVSGCTPSVRTRIVEAVTALPRAGDPGCPGLIESHGILLDLSPANLELLGYDHLDVDVLVRAGDLPGMAGAGPIGLVADASGAGPEPVVALSAEAVADHVPDGLFPELDTARAARATAAEALGVFESAIATAREGYGAAREERAKLEDQVEAAARQLDLVRVAAARAREGEEVEQGPNRDEVAAQVEHLAERLAQIDRSLSELVAIDVKPIEVLLEAIRNPAPTVMMPSERANEVADLIVDLRRQLADVEARLDADGYSITRAEVELEAAKVEAESAQRAMDKPAAGPDDIAELEAAHERVLEAETKASGRLGGRGGKKRLEEALAEQQAVLDRIGFPTWSAYVMGSQLLGIDPIAEQRLEKAKADLEQAEANWAVITETLETDPEYRDLLDRLEAVYLEAFDLLGGDDEREDLETALRHLEVAVQEVTQEDLVSAMAYQFQLLGLDLGEDPPLELVTAAAEALLTEAASINDRLGELKSERTGVATDLAEAEELLATLPEVPPIPLGLTVEEADAEVEAAEDAFDELTDRLRAAREDETDALDLVEAREALAETSRMSFDVATSKLDAIATELATTFPEELAVYLPEEVEASGGREFLQMLEELPRDEAEVVDDDVDPLAEIEMYLLSRLAAQRNLTFAGSVPVVIDGAFDEFDDEQVRSLLERIERMASAVQILVLSDSSAAAAWAGEAGIQRAAVVPAPVP